MKTIGIISTMEEEIIALKRKMVLVNSYEKAGMLFYKGYIDEVVVVLVQCGLGQVCAALCTQILIDLYEVDTIISTGVSGGVHPDMKIGDWVIASDLLDEECEKKTFGEEARPHSEADKYFLEANQKCIEHVVEQWDTVLAEQRLWVGKIESDNAFEGSILVKGKTDSTFVTYCAEMENASIAHTCYLNKIPFFIIRSISDIANPRWETNFDAFINVYTRNMNRLIGRIVSVIA